MNAELLLQQFHRLAEAPGGIPRLRRFILDLAVRGRLTEQDPNDEPAAELLKKIEDWRKHSLRNKNIRPLRTQLKAIQIDDTPFSIPQGWAWTRLGHLIYVHSGDGLTSSQMQKGLIPVYGGNGITGFHNTYNVQTPTVVIGRVGYHCGSIHVTPSKAWITDNAFITEFPSDVIDIAFLVLLLKATNLKERENATAQPVISGSKIYPIIIPLPPLAEQERIVAKVDELMALCDRLEEAQREREAGRDALTAASFHLLNASAAATEFRANARFFFDNLPRLVARPDQIKKLRETILSLAVRGKLTEQDPNDEPASELLKKIEKEKARLVKEGTIKKGKELPPISDAEIPFDVPDGWVWVRLGEVGSVVGGGTPQSKDLTCFTEPGQGIAWLTPADLGKHSDLYITHGARDLTEKGLATSSAQLMPAGTVLFTSRAPIGYTAIAANKISTNQGFKSLVPYILKSNLYIAVYFRAFAKWIDARASGTTFKEVSGKIVAHLPFPLPPLAEQERIVAKVDELMALCDRLEESIEASRKESAALLEGVLHGVFAEGELQD